MKYAVRSNYFQYNPRKSKTIKDAYYNLDQDETKVISLHDSLDEAKKALETLTPKFHRYSDSLAEATVFMITECDWYFDDDYYADGEKTYVDLEMFDDVVFLAAETGEA